MPYHLATRARYKNARDRVRTCDPLLVLYKTLSTGFEPVTSRLTVAHSNQLSYERKCWVGRATKDRTRDNWSLATKRIVIIIYVNYNPMLYQLSYRTGDADRI